MNLALRQTAAMFVDAYRELAAGRLFWITLVLSGLVVACFAAVGIDEEGVKILWFRLGFPPITSETIPPDLLYKQMFVSLGVPLWLGWVATILALVSTSTLIPSFIAGGAIDLSLSKPIGRVRLFITRYLTGLVFAALQVTAFSGACFLLIGIRGGDWQPRVLLAVPIVVLFFSYLFSVMALIGMVTRSSVAALLLTILLWLCIIVVNRTEETLLVLRVQSEMVVERRQLAVDNGVALAEADLARRERDGDPLPPADEWQDGIDDELEAANPMLGPSRERLSESRDTLDAIDRWHGRTRLVQSVFPKTAGTLGLLERSLLSESDYERLDANRRGEDAETPFDAEEPIDAGELQRRMREAMTEQSPAWIVGSSLAFELVMVGLACVVFMRRDF